MSNVLYLVIPIERVEQGKEFVDEIYGAVAWEHQTEGYPKAYPTSCGDVCILERSPEKMVVELAEARAEIDGAIKLCGEYATNAREGCYASLALSIGRLKHQIECELEHKKKLSDCANSGMIANEKIFDQLTEARAEIERLTKNTRFAAAINSAMQEVGQDLPDLRGHECLAKHKLLSLFDFWKKKVRPRLPGFIDDEISRRDALIEQTRDALRLADDLIDEYAADYEHRDNVDEVRDMIKAALSAAERGE